MKMLKQHLVVFGSISLLVATAVTASQFGDRPTLAPGVPDLTKGEGPAIENAHPSWVLHIGRAVAGWSYIDEYRKRDAARQILVTRVPAFSPVRRELQVGDVILGVNGKYFSSDPIQELREVAIPARNNYGSFDVILWREGWEKERLVTLNLVRHLPMDFTKGDKEGLECDWNLGATGARGYIEGLNQHSYVARQILITAVEKGSPADGVLQKGDVIIGLNGEKFASDARRRFGEALAAAETKAGAGKLDLLIWRPAGDASDSSPTAGDEVMTGKTERVTITLPVIGTYSETSPWKCEKNDRMLEQACTYLIENNIIEQEELMHAQSQLAALALMSTGDPAHLEIARKHILKMAKVVDESGECPPIWGYHCWGWGYANLMLTEYHLLTGDEAVLPAIRKLSRLLMRLQSTVGTWGHGENDPRTKRIVGYGAMNQIGNICLMSLILAEKCDSDIPGIDRAIALGSNYLRQFVDLNCVTYADASRLGNKHDDNGKSSSAAVVFALLGDKEATDYFSKMTIASHDIREFGHTGNWWSFLWGPLGAVRGGEAGCSAFLRELAYLHDMERRWDGGFTYQGKLNIALKTGKEHRNMGWDTTGCRILMYTLPRKKLYITGKDGFSVSVPAEDVAGLIEDGARPVNDIWTHAEKYNDLSTDALMERLQRWSPPVRSWAATALAKKDDASVAELMTLLKSKNRYARYGACRALQQLGSKGSPAVDALVPLLSADDSRLVIYASMALGAIGDMRAASPLLELAARDRADDPRQLIRRYASRALFSEQGLLRDSIEGGDREQLGKAIKAILACPGGGERSLAGHALRQMTPEELESLSLWPDMMAALEECAPTGISEASGIRVTVAELIKEYKREGGLESLWTFFKNQKMHGSEKGRNAAIMAAIASYGAEAEVLLPRMEAYLTLIKDPPEHTDPFAPDPNPNFYPGQIIHLEDAIKTIKLAVAQRSVNREK